MATRGFGRHYGSLRNREQYQDSETGLWVKIEADTGEILGIKQDGKPWKNVRKQEPLSGKTRFPYSW